MPVTASQFAQTAYSFRDSGYTYQQYDCIGFVNLVLQTCGVPTLYPGTNTLWRNGTLTWQGTIAQAEALYGAKPVGSLLFRIRPESDPHYNDPPEIPPQYYMDGIGNVTHVGIFTNLGMGVMQSGGYGNPPGFNGVHDSYYDPNYWTHLALCPNIDYNTPGPTPTQGLPTWLLFSFNNRKEMKRKWVII